MATNQGHQRELMIYVEIITIELAGEPHLKSEALSSSWLITSRRNLLISELKASYYFIVLYEALACGYVPLVCLHPWPWKPYVACSWRWGLAAVTNGCACKRALCDQIMLSYNYITHEIIIKNVTRNHQQSSISNILQSDHNVFPWMHSHMQAVCDMQLNWRINCHLLNT